MKMSLRRVCTFYFVRPRRLPRWLRWRAEAAASRSFAETIALAIAACLTMAISVLAPLSAASVGCAGPPPRSPTCRRAFFCGLPRVGALAIAIMLVQII